MTKFFYTLIFSLLCSVGFSQFGTAHDFTVTDIEGNEISLYADILDEGYIAVIDVSATWCPPCWTLHESHVLEDLHQNFGPEGTNQVRVVFYEADAATTMEDLMGNTPGTMGNWLEGNTYPVVNESPVTLDMSVYAPLGFPTLNIIRPSDKEIVADLYNVFDFDAMVNGINEAIGGEVELSVVSSTDNLDSNIDVSLAPNPVVNTLQLDLEQLVGSKQITLLSLTGNVVSNITTQADSYQMDVSTVSEGTYLIQIASKTQTITKQIQVIR